MRLHRRINSKAGALLSAATLGAVLAALVLTGGLGQRADAVELPPVAKRMRVFTHAPVSPQAVPPAVADAQETLPSREQGTSIPGEVRLLGRNLGKNEVATYAFPTTGGVVCVFVTERTSVATCVDSFRRATGNVQWAIYSGISAPQTVVGLASDAVTDVKVVVGGTAEPATLSNNGFFWQSADSGTSRKDIEALLVRQADGQVVRVNLDFGP